MKATDVIRRDHRAAEALFEEYKKAVSAERESIAQKIFKALTAHEKMEDAFFYPALQEKLGDDSAFAELNDEQGALEAETMAIMAMESLTGDSEERILAMMERVLAHAKKEESEILSKAEEVMSADELEELGSKMEPESAAALAG